MGATCISLLQGKELSHFGAQANISNTLPKHLHPLAVTIQIHSVVAILHSCVIEIWGRLYPHSLKSIWEAKFTLPNWLLQTLHTHNSSLCSGLSSHAYYPQGKKLKNKSHNSVYYLNWISNYKLVHRTV